MIVKKAESEFAMKVQQPGHEQRPKRKRAPRTPPSELDYYARMLQKIQTKKHEVYAISRILHRLDDPEIELVTQQAVHTSDGLALLDLYLPQFGVALEVDELHHLAAGSKDADKAREQRVLTLANLEFVRLGIGQVRERDEFRNKVDAFIDDVRSRKQAALSGGTFTPFAFGARFDPDYWRAKGRLTVEDDAQMQVTHHVTRLFGYNHKGWQRAVFPLADGRQLWMPHLAQEGAPKRDDWDNRLSGDGETIVEQRLGDWQTHPYEDVERVVFAKFRDPVLGAVYYRFLGVYRLASQFSDTATFTRISTEIQLPSPARPS
ncbi:AbaSI family restriction endonuclease [Microbacterium sp. NPDC076895]|uniref:AbaSI family restriction endonuclease n=1 Tax=Microbacterium sp. NPDC076895 TaxID=3154957 RepID=UPI00341318EA